MLHNIWGFVIYKHIWCHLIYATNHVILQMSLLLWSLQHHPTWTGRQWQQLVASLNPTECKAAMLCCELWFEQSWGKPQGGIGNTTCSWIWMVFHVWFAAQQKWQVFICFLNRFFYNWSIKMKRYIAVTQLMCGNWDYID